MALDRDSDGLLNRDELLDHNSDPASIDSDGDGLGDADEVNIHNTDPGKADSDSDGLDDPIEISTTLTNPTNPDSDGDNISDGDEVAAGTDPNDAAPGMSILFPADNAAQEPNQSITLSGTALDSEDGDISSGIEWSSDIAGALGSGAGISVALTPGAHVITATVTDSKNATSSATVNVLSLNRGDINADGNVDLIDLIRLQKHLLGFEPIDQPADEARADIYPFELGDGQLTISDLLLLQQWAL
jgi:hypothetical protein